MKELLRRVPEAIEYVFSDVKGRSEEKTLLMEAVDEKNVAVAELLISKGADINARTESFDSALQVAAQHDSPEIVELLIKRHANLNVPPRGKSPLHEALIAGHSKIARILLAAGANQDLYSDIGLGRADELQKKLAADPSLVMRPDGAGRMPMDYAAATGQIDAAKILIDSGAPLADDSISPVEVPIHYAIRDKNIKLIEFLLKSGSSPNTSLGWQGEDSRAETPMHMAITSGSIEIVKLLIAYKADLTVRDTYSRTPLHAAAEEGNAKIAKLLIGAGADVNARQLKFSLPCGSGEEHTPSQNTPLHFAAACGNPETIKVLLAAGAKIDAVNVHGLTPLMSTVKPPLYTAVNEKSQLKNVETLLAAGADVNMKDEKGLTALDHAEVQGVVELLKKHVAKPGVAKPKK
jgi:ankyrin repeat protein